VTSMIDTDEEFSVVTHNATAAEACAEVRNMRLEREQDYLAHWVE